MKFKRLSTEQVYPMKIRSQSSVSRSKSFSGSEKDSSQNPTISAKPKKVTGFLNFLDLTVFKTNKCKEPLTNHNLKRCPDYHDKTKDRRRKLGHYKSELCAFIAKKKSCPQGENCTYCHNRVEEFYHPDKYKAKFCSCFTKQNSICEYGEYCSFAHSEAEISVDLIEKFEKDTDFYMFHYKTVWCPYTEGDESHERSTCVYAHNW